MQNAAGGMGRVRQPVLPLLPVEARAIGPSAGLVEGPDGGVVFVFGLATFVYAAGDETGRRPAAVQLARLLPQLRAVIGPGREQRQHRLAHPTHPARCVLHAVMISQ